MENQEFIEFQEIKFFWHPFHKDYLASKCGKILSLKRREKKILKIIKRRDGYLTFHFCEINKKRKYLIHHFVFETFKGEIPKGMEIDHYDSNKKNNSVSNLQLLSHKENVRKSCCKKVISLNIETQEEKIFDSLKKAGEFFNINPSSVFKCCQKIIKTSKSKKDGKKYQFFYFKN